MNKTQIFVQGIAEGRLTGRIINSVHFGPVTILGNANCRPGVLYRFNIPYRDGTWADGNFFLFYHECYVDYKRTYARSMLGNCAVRKPDPPTSTYVPHVTGKYQRINDDNVNYTLLLHRFSNPMAHLRILTGYVAAEIMRQKLLFASKQYQDTWQRE